uniref:uncharacterized mitochondrial protein AtMg00810-like n=1 Tax=Erigeron canadensis TaxID=72917 RepID=UPI001CB9637B|nr:uncharacterized mitochondrial protein AtMg00810-like [Erigeron canadensis]
MSKKDELSMMGELNYFSGLQVKQNKNGLFINQGKYVKDLLNKFGFSDCSPMKTPMGTGDKLGEDNEGKSVDITTYRGMIGSLLYLTASRPDIMFVTCLCARYRASPKESHLKDMKRIFKYLKGCKMDRKSTPGACQLLGNRLEAVAHKFYGCSISFKTMVLLPQKLQFSVTTPVP